MQSMLVLRALLARKNSSYLHILKEEREKRKEEDVVNMSSKSKI
jgi:hypothetical protein